MRVFALSDLHVDCAENATWVADLSRQDYTNDILLLAGDVSDRLGLLAWCLDALVRRFATVLFVPGNHDLWVIREPRGQTSFDKLARVHQVTRDCGASLAPYHRGDLSIVPLLGWYDESFGAPGPELRERWMDYVACVWPPGIDSAAVTASFLEGNERALGERRGSTCISFSHFLPRIDVMPATVSAQVRMLFPVFGSTGLEAQIRRLMPRLHVYGHSHLNRRVDLDGITYINNALGHPHEAHIAARRLLCIHQE